MRRKRFGKALAFTLALVSLAKVAQKEVNAFSFEDIISWFRFTKPSSKEELVEKKVNKAKKPEPKKTNKAKKSNPKKANEIKKPELKEEKDFSDSEDRKKSIPEKKKVKEETFENSDDNEEMESGRVLSRDEAISRAQIIIEDLFFQIERIATPGLQLNMESARCALKRRLGGSLNIRTANTLLGEANRLVATIESILSNQSAMAKSAEIEKQKIELERKKAEDEAKRQEKEAEFQRKEIQRISEQEQQQQKLALESLKRSQHASLSYIETRIAELEGETLIGARDRVEIIRHTIGELTVDEILSGAVMETIKKMMDDLNKFVSDAISAKLANEIRATRNLLIVKIQKLSAKEFEFTDPNNGNLATDLLNDLRDRTRAATTLDGLKEIREAILETETIIDGLLQQEKVLAEKKRIEDELQAELLANRNMAIIVSKLRTGAMQLKDVYAGNKVAIKRLNDWQESIKKYKTSKSVPASKGALLIGPAGVGKTVLVRYLAASRNSELVVVTPADLTSAKGIEKVTKTFESAQQFAKEGRDVMLLLDELDGMVAEGKIATALQNLIDKFDHLSFAGLFSIIGTSNYIDRIPEPLKRAGRMDLEIIMNNPTIEDIEQIIKVLLRGVKLDSSVNVKYFAGRLVGSSGAEIERIINNAIEINLEKTGVEKLAKVVISAEDLESSINR
ncbi:MAG: AAA family ATPase [Oscillospiraceae bacterium]|jgi:ATP-dependent 26S proteasome regulatory subunit|nr:AAA family ATPase [Oscillospiraceae bacterium]